MTNLCKCGHWLPQHDLVVAGTRVCTACHACHGYRQAPFLPLPIVAMTPGEHVGSWNVFRLSPLARGGTGESATEHNVPTGDLAPDAVAWLKRHEESER